MKKIDSKKKIDAQAVTRAADSVRKFTKPVLDRLGELPPRLGNQTINGKGGGGTGDSTNASPPRSVQVFGNSVSLGRPNSVTLFLGALILLVFFAILLANGRNASGETELSSTEVKRGVVEVTSTGSGSIESARNTDLNFESSGTVTEVFVEEGDKVKEGQAIAKLDRRSARLEVAVAKANLEDLENGTSTSTTGVSYSGDASTSGETVNAVYTGSASTTSIAVISDATSQAVTGATDVVCADGETEVTDPSTGAITCEPAVTGPTGPTGATGPAGGSDEPVDPSVTPEDDVTVPSTGSDPGLSTGGAVTGGTPSAGAATGGATGGTSSSVSDTDIKSARLDLEEAREAYRNTILRAPYSGTIVSLEGAVGDSVGGSTTTSTGSDTADSSASAAGVDSATTSTSTSSAFAVLQQLDSLEMSVDVSEADINDIEVGQRATVSVSSADDEQLAAKVSNVGLLATTDSSGVVTYPVTVRVSQGSQDVRPGMSANVSIVIDQVSGAINVPNQAVSGNSVEVEGADGDAETRTVETGIVGDSTTEILSGLEVGDTVLIPQASSSTSAAIPGGDAAASGGFPGGAMPSGGGIPGGGAMPSGGMPSGGFPGG